MRRAIRTSRASSGVRSERSSSSLVGVVLRRLDAEVVGDERGGLDLEERRGDENEVARDVEVHVAHPVDLVEVLVGDVGDRDGADVDPLPAHQLQEQVEGAREGLCPHAVAHAQPPRSTFERPVAVQVR
jgi:hypothetical protein